MHKMNPKNIKDEKNSLTDYFGYKVYIDKKVVVALRDGRYLSGILKSYDYRGDITLLDTVATTFHNDEYALEAIGFMVLRGSGITFIAMADISFEDFSQISLDVINEKIALENNARFTNK